MNKTGSISSLTPKTVHRQFFHWAVKWFYSDNITENTSKKPDIGSIICLLQTVGFKLREFEKSEDQLIPINDPLKPDNVRITMECGTSKMVAILESDEITCECPDKHEAKDGSFWSMTGTGPVTSSLNSVNRIEESGSNLLPVMSKETTAVVHDVVHKLFNMINNKADVNQNTEPNMNISGMCADSPRPKINQSKEGLSRSYTDYFDKNFKPLTSTKMTSNLIDVKFGSSQRMIRDTKKDMTVDAFKKPTLKREGTYELDDNENSPALQQQLDTSLGQVSVQSDEELLGLADYVVNAHQILDKAVNYILKKLPSSNFSHISIPDTLFSDEKEFMRPAPPSLMNNSVSLNSSHSSGSNSRINRSVSSGSSSRPGSACSIPRTTNQSTTVRSVPTVQKPQARRAASLSGTQRPAQPSPNAATGNVTGITRRRCTISGTSGIAQRTTPSTASRQPASKPTLTKTANTSLSTTLGSNGNTPRTTPRANLSFIKEPSTTTNRTPRLNSVGTGVNARGSKFGYSAVKK